MAVDVEIAPGLHDEVDQPVAGDLLEHVVEEADAGRELRPPASVEVDGHADLRFPGVANHLGSA
jgi:hypothetical protein